MGYLRESSIENPLSQREILSYVQQNPDEVFMVKKKPISVKLKKIGERETVETVVLARDGRKIHETSNVAQKDDGVDIRYCADGSIDQYVKKPHKIAKTYTIDDGRQFAEVEAAEKVEAHTVNEEVRKAFVVNEDLYMMSRWGKVQFVARGGIVTIARGEAIGNNNPCDMVLHTEQGDGRKVLTEKAFVIQQDMSHLKLPVSLGAERFLQIAGEEDAKGSLLVCEKEKNLVNMVKQRVLKMKMRLIAWREKTMTLLSSNRIQKKIVARKDKGHSR